MSKHNFLSATYTTQHLWLCFKRRLNCFCFLFFLSKWSLISKTKEKYIDKIQIHKENDECEPV